MNSAYTRSSFGRKNIEKLFPCGSLALPVPNFSETNLKSSSWHGKILGHITKSKMLKVSCNLTDQIQALGSSHSISFRQRSDALSLSPTKAGGNAAVKAVMSDQNGGLTRIDSGSVSLADRFKLGSLTEDGLFYKEKFIVRSWDQQNCLSWVHCKFHKGSWMQPYSKSRVFNWGVWNHISHEKNASYMGYGSHTHWDLQIPCMGWCDWNLDMVSCWRKNWN